MKYTAICGPSGHQKFYSIKIFKIIRHLSAVLLCFISASSFAQKPDLFLLKTYQDDKDVTGWLMSEKLDGVRAYWNGRQLISRGGHVFNAPSWFIEGFPSFELDGELWTKRNDFENIVSIVRQQQPDERWSQIRYRVFEAPNQPGDLLARLAVFHAVAVKPSHVEILPQVKVESQTHLNAFLQEIVDQGGEGVVVRDPAVHYQTGRLSSALKFKLFQDAECKVTGYRPGRGKYKNLVGALECQLEDQTQIRVGSGLSDLQRKQPPAIGSTISFKYYGLTGKGLPRFPVFLRPGPLAFER